MSRINELLQEFVDMEYEELLYAADNALDVVLPACEDFAPDDEGVYLFTAIILSAVGADGVLSVKERTFIKDAVGLDDETIDSVIDMYDDRLAELADDFADSVDESVKASVAAFILCILACDGNISREENEFIRKIIK